MINSLLLFLGHGGFKLLIIGFFLAMKVVKANAKKVQTRKAQLRGNTGIQDFSTDAAPAAVQPAPFALFAPSPATSKMTEKPSNAPLTSPWSSNQNPFDNPKS